MRVLILSLLAAATACASNQGPTPAPAPPPPSPAQAGGLEESDFRGELDRAAVFATLATDGGGAHVRGSLFYARIGTDIPVSGELRDGVLTLHELDAKKKAISTITLENDGQRWRGTWSNGTRSGDAALERIVSGDEVFVATRVRSLKKGKLAIPCVLGLARRDVQHTLDAALEHAAERLVMGGTSTHGSFRVTRNAGGLFSVVIEASYEDDAAPTHIMSHSVAVNASLSNGAVSSDPGAIVDEERARALFIAHKPAGGEPDRCEEVDELEGAAFSKQGVELCFECTGPNGHVHWSSCADIPRSDARAAMATHSPFGESW